MNIRPKNISNLDIPVLLMNFPSTIDNKVPNNIYMDMDEKYDLDLAFSQWLLLYHRLSEKALVYILPSQKDFQDLTFISNVGCYLPHIKDNNIIILSNFNSVPRRGEELIARPFLESMGYEIYQPLTFFEGEADCKYIRDNTYVSSIGRTVHETHDWLENEFGMNIVSIKVVPELYHLDCVLFPISSTHALVVTSVLDKKDIKKLEDIIDIIEVPKQFTYESWTNSFRIENTIFSGCKHELAERKFRKILYKYDLELETFNLSEFEKSGGDLSCFIMKLNKGY